MFTFETPGIPAEGYLQMAPLITVFLGACFSVGIETFSKRGRRARYQVPFTAVVLLIALVFTVINWGNGLLGIGGVAAIAVDGPTYFMWTMLLLLALMSLLIFAERRLGGGTTAFTPQAASVPGTPAEEEAIKARLEQTEIYPLFLFALTGMLLFPAANDLITMFVALEVLSLPLYLMSGMARRRRLLSQEAALKYFLLGSLSSAFFLFGAALLYGYSGSLMFREISIAAVNHAGTDGLLFGGMALLGIGLLFKVGAVPFHSWTPDVYQGAPTPVTAFMAACTKIAAVGALLRVFYVGLGARLWDWQPLFAVIALLTMIIGTIFAITQTDIKRLLAYSSIAHAGFILVAIVGAAQAETGTGPGQLTSVGAVLFYLAAYGMATVGAFAIVTMVRNDGGEVNSIAAWAGLGRKSPGLAAAFALFLLSFAGIPLTSGFIGKWAVFAAAWNGGYGWLVVVAVIVSLVAAYIYLRVIMTMFFTAPVDDTRVVTPSWMTSAVVIVGCAVTVILGILPGPLLDVATMAGEFLR
ncbi:MAG TPA: NADH-quinone oxidoreductase subunit NuoN [Propionibacterium sp.]|jgi:NADH-quinone oxidoreductase subunit N|nr:NADH-quinone oxidoreductase subunit NuoN [Propionibacterium sp.]